MWVALCDMAVVLKALAVCQKVRCIFSLKFSEVSGHQTKLHSIALLIFLHFHKITAELKQTKVKRASRGPRQAEDQWGNKTWPSCFPDANFPLLQLKATIHKVGNVLRATIRLLSTRSSLRTKDVKAFRGARVWWGGGASPFKPREILGEQHGGNECCCQSLLDADRLFFKGRACHSTSVERRMEGWRDGWKDRWMVARSTCTSIFGQVYTFHTSRPQIEVI